MKRIEELCDKLYHPTNSYCRKNIGKWMLDADKWATKRAHKASCSKKVLMLRYVLNHLCPNLQHLKPNPAGFDFRKLSIEEYNRISQEYTMENSQAEFTARETGVVLQEGIHGVDEEYDYLLFAVYPIMKASGDALSVETFSISPGYAKNIVQKYSEKLSALT